MELSSQNTFFLQKMGIPLWELRHSEKTSKNGLATLKETVTSCTRCPLAKTRSQTVFARGSESAKLLIVGEAPGFYEDQQGLPFVGKAGHLLDAMLEAIGLKKDSVYITNVLKCRPPENRDPKREEINACSAFLEAQITYVEPKIILALGRYAGQFLLNSKASLGAMRNKTYSYKNALLQVSYHPAYLLRNPKDKKKAFQDWVAMRERLMSL